MHTRIFAFLLLSVPIIAAIGCSDNVPMRGKVTFSDDQSPLTVGTVEFQSDTVLSRGDLKPDGTYVLGTEKLTDGIPKGTYRVSIANTMRMFTPDGELFTGPPPAMGVGGGGGGVVMRSLIAPLEPKTVVVDGKQREYNIVVDRP
ncbi:MAG: hypothetical protein FWD31_01205 [Planctomycetaceae bacterium]|nr:hypothetical protein [Planctomycetaceae bacterium]